MEAAGRRGGVVLRVDGELRFVAAPLAMRVTPPPRVTAIPGAPPELLGITLYEGAVIPVVAVGAARAEMIVCQHAGEVLGLVGGEVVATGSFGVVDGQPDLVQVDGARARPLDVAALYARVQSSTRPGRWA
jgi:hypothetical protein